MPQVASFWGRQKIIAIAYVYMTFLIFNLYTFFGNVFVFNIYKTHFVF